MGGKAFIEICKSDGTVQRIEVDPEQSPFMPEKPHMEDKQDCPFCLNFTDAKNVHKGDQALENIIQVVAIRLSSGTFAFPASITKSFNSTGPPATLS